MSTTIKITTKDSKSMQQTVEPDEPEDAIREFLDLPVVPNNIKKIKTLRKI